MFGVEYRNLQRMVEYTNYKKSNDGESIITISKNILVSAGLSVDGSFDNAKSSVQMQYISSKEDTVQTTIDFLMQKQFFDKNMLDGDIKMIYYDMFGDVYRIFQPSEDHPTGLIPIWLDFGGLQTQ